MEKNLTWEEFSKVEMRIGTIISAVNFEKALHPAFQMLVDFGKYGKRKTSAQITKKYTANELIGKQVIGVLNFPPKQIANMMSECLILGSLGDENEVILLTTDKPVKNGTKVG